MFISLPTGFGEVDNIQHIASMFEESALRLIPLRGVEVSVFILSTNQGGNSWGGWGAVAPPTFGQQHFFSHTTDRKVPSEVVLMGSFMSVIYGNVQ